MFPARSKAALRPSRRASASRLQRPTVMAATAGAKRPPSTAMTISAAKTTGSTGKLMIASPQPASINVSDDERPLGACAVVEFAGRGMGHHSNEAGGGENGARRRLTPARICDKENVEIRAKPAAHIGEEKIEPVQSIEPHRREALE